MDPPTPAPFQFKSSRLIYRGIEKEDIDFFYALCQDASALAAMSPSLLQPNSRQVAENQMKKVTENALMAVVICLPAGSGHAALLPTPSPLLAHHRSSHLGIGLLPAYRSQGYGTEAIQWMLEYSFRIANLHRVELQCFGWNVAAKKVYERCGFRVEGFKREAMWWDGRWWGVWEMGLLEAEWREIQGGKEVEVKKGKEVEVKGMEESEGAV